MGVIRSDRPFLGQQKYETWSFTRERLRDLEVLCGFRADWVILFEPVEEEFLNTIVKPFLIANSSYQWGSPVIWTATKERILP
jgi:hypothetical protein